MIVVVTWFDLKATDNFKKTKQNNTKQNKTKTKQNEIAARSVESGKWLGLGRS